MAIEDPGKTAWGWRDGLSISLLKKAISAWRLAIWWIWSFWISMSPDPENIHSNIKIIYREIFYNNIKYFAHIPLVNSKHAKDGTHIFCQTLNITLSSSLKMSDPRETVIPCSLLFFSLASWILKISSSSLWFSCSTARTSGSNILWGDFIPGGAETRYDPGLERIVHNNHTN